MTTVSSFEPPAPPATTQNSSPPAESTAAARGTGPSARTARGERFVASSRAFLPAVSARRSTAQSALPSRTTSRKPTSITTSVGVFGVPRVAPREPEAEGPEVRHASRTRRRPSAARAARSAASNTKPFSVTYASSNGAATSGGPPANAGGAHGTQRGSGSVSSQHQRHAATPPSSCAARSASGVAFDASGGTKTTRATRDAP